MNRGPGQKLGGGKKKLRILVGTSFRGGIFFILQLEADKQLKDDGSWY